MPARFATDSDPIDRRCERCRNGSFQVERPDCDESDRARVICFRCFVQSHDDRDGELAASQARTQLPPSPAGRALSAVDIEHRRRMLAHLRTTPGRGR
jgi:hypothetical protein